MRQALSLALLLLEVSNVLAAKVLPVSFQRKRGSATASSLRRRASTVPVTVTNAQVYYYANVEVGTPGQALELLIDTGSSDVWMTDSSAQYCSQSQQNCAAGTFTPSSSSTYDSISGSDFNITYVDGTGSSGTYFKDDFTIGGVKLTNLQMGLATDTTIGMGIIGLCFELDESVCNTAGTCPTYPSIVSQMVSQGYINSQAYSLWLDDLEASTGTLLFGGIDTDKFTGNLITIPIQVDSYSLAYTSFSVAFTSLSMETSSGTTTYTSSGFAQAAILDSGTSLTLLPDDLFQAIVGDLGLQAEGDVYLAPCSDVKSGTTYNFQFGGSNGPVIKVPMNEFFFELQGYTLSNGAQACEFGMLPAGSDPILFGDTFLRSAYVVYDLDNKQISIAQTNFDSTSSNIEVIEAGSGGVPSVSGTASGVSVAQTATGLNSYGVETATATSTGAASSNLNLPGTDITGVVMLGLGSMLALLGSCLIFF